MNPNRYNSKFDEHLVNDIQLTLENERSVYDKLQWLKNAVVKKVSRGIEFSIEKLAASPTLDRIVGEGLKIYRKIYEDEPKQISPAERKAVRQYFAEKIANWIEDDNYAMQNESKVRKVVDRMVLEAFNDIVQWQHFDNDREPQYDAYVVVDNSDGAIVANYQAEYSENAREEAISEAEEEAQHNKYGSYSVYGCIGNEYDENTLVYNTYKESNESKENEGCNVNEGVNDDNYTHFAILKPINKIVNGWDYSGEDPEDLKQFKKDYFITDMVDYGFNPKDIKILTRKGCIKQGIDPSDDSNWDNGFEYMVESKRESFLKKMISETVKKMTKNL